MQIIFLAKVKRNVEAAQLLFDHQMYDESANRAYYAAFQAARAALSAIGVPIEGFKHKAVQANFNTELIQKRKIYPGYLKSCLLELQLIRNDADYKLIFTTKKSALTQLKKAQGFVNFIQQEIGEP
jgi:uncharacterized protein (UPF0332 family)